MSETVYTDCATLLTASATPSASGTHEVNDTNKLSVLLANAGTVSYSDTANSSSALGFAVDLAGCSLTLTSKSAKSQWNSLKLVRFFNGSVSISQKVMNTKLMRQKIFHSSPKNWSAGCPRLSTVLNF